jgi:hypothetical protein
VTTLRFLAAVVKISGLFLQLLVVLLVPPHPGAPTKEELIEFPPDKFEPTLSQDFLITLF